MNEEILKKCVAEILGTFIFLGVIITLVNNPSSNLRSLKIGLSLMIAIVFFGSVSGGHFNPAVSFMLYMNDKINETDLIFYIISQLIGALLAYFVFVTIIENDKKKIN